MKKLLYAALFCLYCFLNPFIAQAQGWDEATYRQIEQSIQQPQISGNDYLITKFGAKPQATAAQNQRAIQKAIDRCSKKGGGRVIVPAGQTFLTAVCLRARTLPHRGDIMGGN